MSFRASSSIRPTTVADAVALLDQHKKDAWKLAGGNDSLSWFKDRIKRPKVVVDVSGVAEMKGVKETADGIEIGALTTLTEIENNPLVKKSYRLLADAAGKVASPQIRNTGTIGGNVSQDARCWYYRCGSALLSRRRQHLLRRHAGRAEPRARDFRRQPLRGGVAVGPRAGHDCARRQDGDPQRQGRARRRRPRSSLSGRASTSPA